MLDPKVLIVDDDPSVRILLKETLLRDGYDVKTAASGAEALRILPLHNFDIALLDLQLNDMSGLDILAEMRRQAHSVVVIILTGHASLQSAVDALRQGAHDYLFKPFKTLELRESMRSGLLKRQQELAQRERLAELERSVAGVDVEAVQAKLQATSALMTTEDSRFLRRGNMVVDFLRHVITLDGRFLELSPTEFDLLAYLINALPRVVSQDELAREVQGYLAADADADETLRYHIYRLRRKIKEATGRADLIRTVRGIGYTLADENNS